ncbi:27095_t:CDS:2 [Dentiscutata erythropus]|uniref:27095_t:CDS:1 n=1 Tax=Dentiscutata erythropus TaxID=1348616 RepID=A0A9N9HS81_9GLOM|nr:27095_t:CDS:2 [Dentiscutata erythropus]
MTTLQTIGVDKSPIESLASLELEFVSYKDALSQWGLYKNKDELCPSHTEFAVDGDSLKNLSGNNEKQMCMEMVDHDDHSEFVIDEHASSCSNGIIVNENDQEIDVEIDLEGFDIDFQVCNNTLAIFGSSKPTEDLDSSSETASPNPSTATFRHGRRYQSFCHPIRLSTDFNVNKIFSIFIDGKMHIKVPKKNGVDIIEESLAVGYCAICKWKECLSKSFLGLSFTEE